MICKDTKQLNFYFKDMIDRLVNSGREFTSNQVDRVEEKEDVYFFMTPDRPEKLLGLYISGWEELGTCCEHPKFDKLLDEIERRLI